MLWCFIFYYDYYHGIHLEQTASDNGSACCGSPLPLMPRDTRGVVSPATVLQQQPQSQMPPQAYANYIMVPLMVNFFFRVEPLIDLPIHVGICYGVCYLLSGAILDASLPMGRQLLALHHCIPLHYTHVRHICILVMVIDQHQECTKWLLPPLLLVGEALCHSVSCPLSIPTIW